MPQQEDAHMVAGTQDEEPTPTAAGVAAPVADGDVLESSSASGHQLAAAWVRQQPLQVGSSGSKPMKPMKQQRQHRKGQQQRRQQVEQDSGAYSRTCCILEHRMEHS